jgi:hypothetical protein
VAFRPLNLGYKMSPPSGTGTVSAASTRPGAEQAAEKGLFLAKLAQKVLPGLKPAFILLAVCRG